MIRINQVKLKTDHTRKQLERKVLQLLPVKDTEILGLEILRQSVDARKKPDIYYIYSLLVQVQNEEAVLKALAKPKWEKVAKQHGIEAASPSAYHFPEPKTHRLSGKGNPVVIVGCGPAGLFCGYYLAKGGYAPILLERGKPVEERREDVERFWREGVLNPSSNVQFGEGGAGTFSDGKLNTLVKDKEGRNRAVLETFVKFGAQPSVLYEAKPHIGTDVLCGIVRRMREEIIRLGGVIRFQSQVTELLTEGQRVRGVVINARETLPCKQLVLAIGHSARDTFSMLYDKGVPMEAKSFAVGLRVQHPQEMINLSQYKTADPGKLGAAAYKLTAQAENKRGVYSFCMCPGGYVVNASSEEGRLAVNGMSYSGRDSRAANSAIIVSVTSEDYGSKHPLAGIAFQRRLEERAFLLGGGKIPVQRYDVFQRCVETGMDQEQLLAKGVISGLAAEAGCEPLCKGDFCYGDVSRILPRECNEAFVDGMKAFGRQIKGFDGPEALLLGVESRTSSPVRIHRDETLQSAIRGIYPCGEGAGYAGGITSAAMDGLRVAEAIAGELERH